MYVTGIAVSCVKCNCAINRLVIDYITFTPVCDNCLRIIPLDDLIEVESKFKETKLYKQFLGE